MGGLIGFVGGEVLKKSPRVACGRLHASHRCRISAVANPRATTMGLFVSWPSLVTPGAASQGQKYSTNKKGPLSPGPHWQIPQCHGPRSMASSSAESGLAASETHRCPAPLWLRWGIQPSAV